MNHNCTLVKIVASIVRRFLTGTQGEAPAPFWDPLAFTIQEGHARGIEIHVWLNPYRANVNADWSGLASNHMANVYREYAYPYDTYLWMDPGAQVVIDHTVDVIADIVTKSVAAHIYICMLSS